MILRFVRVLLKLTQQLGGLFKLFLVVRPDAVGPVILALHVVFDALKAEEIAKRGGVGTFFDMANQTHARSLSDPGEVARAGPCGGGGRQFSVMNCARNNSPRAISRAMRKSS